MQKSGSPEESNFWAGNLKTVIIVDEPGSKHYVPLPIQNLIPGQKVPFEVLVRIKVSGQAGDQYQTCCPPGQRFEPVWLTKLQ